MKRILKALTPIIRPLMLRYLSVKRKYEYDGISIVIYPGVFHPGFFFSTKLLLKFLKTQNLAKSRVLELGAGSGLISIYCFKIKHAIVTASDISIIAVKNIEENARNCNADINIVQSDLFDNLDPGNFDFIIINPPYYPKTPITESENAWYCGDNFQYFRRLFPQLKNRTKSSVKIYMIVSEDCDIDKIVNIANQNCFQFDLILEKKIWGERNFIYKIFDASETKLALT